jgi:hypothetical protein
MTTRGRISGLTKRIEALAAISTKPQLVVVGPGETIEQAAQRHTLPPGRCIFIHTGVPRPSEEDIRRG